MNKELDFQNYILSNLKELYEKETNKIFTIKNKIFHKYYDYVMIDDYLLFYKWKNDKYTFEIIKNIYYHIHVNIGVELETCLIISYPKIDNIPDYYFNYRILINFLKNEFYPTLTNSFIQKQKFIYIELEGRYIEYNLICNSIKTVYNYKNNYKYILLTSDGSIKCEQKDKLLFAIEIVTNINENIEDLFEILDVFNPFSKPNESTGFHINISLNDKNNNRIKLIDPLLFELVKLWLPYERENYLKTRQEIKFYAKPLYLFIDEKENKNKIEFGKIDNEIDNEINNDIKYNKKFDTEENKKILNIISEINLEKYLSFTNWKNIDVLEFRMFEAKDDITKLKDYINDVVIILYETLKNYFSSMNFILMRYTYLYNKYNDDLSKKLDKIIFSNHDDNFNIEFSIISKFRIIHTIDLAKLIDIYYFIDFNEIKIFQIESSIISEFRKSDEKNKYNKNKILSFIFKNMKFIKYTTFNEIIN